MHLHSALFLRPALALAQHTLGIQRLWSTWCLGDLGFLGDLGILRDLGDLGNLGLLGYLGYLMILGDLGELMILGDLVILGYLGYLRACARILMWCVSALSKLCGRTTIGVRSIRVFSIKRPAYSIRRR